MRSKISLTFVFFGLLSVAAFRGAPSDDIVLGEGAHRYAWVEGWGVRADGRDLGNTHGAIVVDAAGHIYVNTDTEDAVVVFDESGAIVRTFGEALKGGLHGMTIVEEDGREYLYAAHTARHEVVKLTLEGEIVWAMGYPKGSGLYTSAGQYRPTSVAVGPNGHLYVADGYGLSWVHHYDQSRNYLRSFGGHGNRRGQMRTPHGLAVVDRGGRKVLAVADRENHRLQFFDWDGRLLDIADEGLRRPCNIDQRGDDLVVADLAGRVTILGPDNQVVCHLGDNPDEKKRARNGIPRAQWQDGHFISPHAAAWDRKGNLYVMDWLALGRITKLRRLE